MSIFGWSYPPGCSSTPFDEPCICEVCWQSDISCDCPECPICGEIGRPECYDEGHLVLSEERKAQISKYKAAYEAAHDSRSDPDYEQLYGPEKP